MHLEDVAPRSKEGAVRWAEPKGQLLNVCKFFTPSCIQPGSITPPPVRCVGNRPWQAPRHTGLSSGSAISGNGRATFSSRRCRLLREDNQRGAVVRCPGATLSITAKLARIRQLTPTVPVAILTAVPHLQLIMNYPGGTCRANPAAQIEMRQTNVPNRPQTIQIFLPQGDPAGIRMAEITISTVRVFDVPRTLLTDFLKIPEAGQVGLYFYFRFLRRSVICLLQRPDRQRRRSPEAAHCEQRLLRAGVGSGLVDV